MAKIEGVIKSEIVRLAKREIRTVFIPLRSEVRKIRSKVSALSKGVTSINRLAKGLHLEEAKPKLEATPEEVKVARLTPERIRGLRKKLGISQRELGILTGVTIGAAASWESGKFKPKGEKKAALVALCKLRKRDVKKMLAQKAEQRSKPLGLKKRKKQAVKRSKYPSKKPAGKKK